MRGNGFVNDDLGREIKNGAFADFLAAYFQP